MKLEAVADINVIALGTPQSISAMLDITAPPAPQTEQRPATSVQIVLDRSGSMEGERLQSALAAIRELVPKLQPDDCFGLVVFDDQALVAVPNRPMREHDLPRVLQTMAAIRSGGSTDISAGYTLGLSEVRRHLPDGGASIIMLSDGHANRGTVDSATFESLAQSAATGRIVTSAIGIGSGYDERLLAARDAVAECFTARGIHTAASRL